LAEVSLFDPAGQDDQLLPEESLLRHQFNFTAREVRRYTENN
jgi:hypothetical protein